MPTSSTRYVAPFLWLIAIFAPCNTQAETLAPPASEKPASEKPASEKPASEKPASEQIDVMLAKVPDGTAWQDVSPELRAEFEARAGEFLKRDRVSWGPQGLAVKENVLFYGPTQAMLDNMDRVLGVEFAALLPHRFCLERDVTNLALKRLLIRIYLYRTSSRAYMLLNHPEFRGWDGVAVKDVELLDDIHVKSIAKYLAETEAHLRKIPAQDLTETERFLRDQSIFITRANKYFDRPAVGKSGAFGLSSVYHLGSTLCPFTDNNELLDAYNASMFSDFRDVNKGSLESFQFYYESEFDKTWLTSQGMSAPLADNVLKLGNLYRTRVLNRPDCQTPCTFYSAEDRAANWDSFTAKMLANQNGQESMEGYALAYSETARWRAGELCKLAQATVDQLFPPGAPELSADQRRQVAARLAAETKPAAIIETISAALDEATGHPIASDKFKAAVARQARVGGYGDGEELRAADEKTVLEMWNSIRAFLKREYGGYPVAIAAMVPERPVILAHSDVCHTMGGEVSIGLKNEWNKSSLYSTMLHEIKHAIDERSHNAVEGAAWEGAATSVERQVWPSFLAEVIPDKTDLLVAQLITAVDNVRFTATTDATLKTFLRAPDHTGLDSFEYAKQVVATYGYSDPKILALRSKRANAGTQYLEYDYGLKKYMDLLDFLQTGIGATPRVDAYLLQACGMSCTNENQASIDQLKTIIQSRH